MAIMGGWAVVITHEKNWNLHEIYRNNILEIYEDFKDYYPSSYLYIFSIIICSW